MGLQVKHGAGVRLNQVYTPLVTAMRPDWQGAPRRKREERALVEGREPGRLLLDLLAEQSLYVSGDPGSGKSTFCRWVTWLTCNGAMPSVDVPPPEQYQEKFPDPLRGRLPVLVRLRDFWPHLPASGAPSIGLAGLERALERWLSEEKPPGLEWVNLKAHLENGSAMLMLDGVDEVPTERRAGDGDWYPREMLLEVLAEAIKRWTKAATGCW